MLYILQDIYFVRHQENNSPRGKLYGKYYNSTRALRTSGLVSKCQKPKKRMLTITSTRENRIYSKNFLLSLFMNSSTV